MKCLRSDVEVEPEIHLNGAKLSCKSGTRFCYDIPALSLSTPLLSLKLTDLGNFRFKNLTVRAYCL